MPFPRRLVLSATLLAALLPTAAFADMIEITGAGLLPLWGSDSGFRTRRYVGADSGAGTGNVVASGNIAVSGDTTFSLYLGYRLTSETEFTDFRIIGDPMVYGPGGSYAVAGMSDTDPATDRFASSFLAAAGNLDPKYRLCPERVPCLCWIHRPSRPNGFDHPEHLHG